MGAGSLALRDATSDDIPVLFEFQRDRAACHMAAFTSTDDPDDENAFTRHRSRVLATASCTSKVILLDGTVVGSVEAFDVDGETEVTYWIDRNHWGKGIATEALAELLRIVRTRPIFARAAADNGGSAHVLRRNGFTVVGAESSYANARGQETRELVYRLD